MISQAASQLPLLIEDASRPIKGDDEVVYSNLFYLKLTLFVIYVCVYCSVLSLYNIILCLVVYLNIALTLVVIMF